MQKRTQVIADGRYCVKKTIFLFHGREFLIQVFETLFSTLKEWDDFKNFKVDFIF